MSLIIDEKILRQVLEDFHSITESRISFFDSERKWSMVIPEELAPFCAERRKNPAFLQRCTDCDTEAFKYADTHDEIHIYQCHAGKTEGVKSIKIDGEIVAYVMFGQIEKSTDKFPAFARLLSIICEFLTANHYVYRKSDTLINQIAQFIDDNISQSISINFLCKKFYIGRTTLFNLFKKHFDTTISAYINNHRMQKSLELLKTNSVSVTAELLGFLDTNYFARQFKKTFNKTPTQYKNSTKKEG